MEQVTNTSYEALTRYFHTLSVLGYKNYDEVTKMVVLLYIEEIFSTVLGNFVTDKDYRTISNVLHCLYGDTCLIPYPEFLHNQDGLYHWYEKELRISEDYFYRETEDDSYREKS